jgi:hypothetical protein
MALNPKLAVARRNAALNNILASLNNGYLRIYDGTQPANADTGISSQVKLAELRFGATAFASASGGSASANAITSDSSADATGTATWFRCFESDGTTVVMDGSVGTTGCNLNLNTTAISASAQVSVTALSATMAEG